MFEKRHSSETHFDLVARKIGEKLENLVIYGDILVDFLRILNTKLGLSQKLKIAKLRKFVLHPLHDIAHLLSKKIGHFSLFSNHFEGPFSLKKIVKLFNHKFYHTAYLLFQDGHLIGKVPKLNKYFLLFIY